MMTDEHATPETDTSAAEVAPARWKTLLAQAGELLRRAFVRVFREMKSTAAYYGSHRVGLAKLFAEYATFFKEHGTRREIQVSPTDNYQSITWDGSEWRVQLPDCCVVCGEAADQDWCQEQRVVQNLTYPLWMPVLGLTVGVFVAIWWINRWYILLLFLAGTWAGYRLASNFPAWVRYRRCRKHANQTHVPELRWARGSLIVEVGHRAVHRKFREAESGTGPSDVVPSDADEIVRERPAYVPTLDPPKLDLPPIPLAGDDEEESTEDDTPQTSKSSAPSNALPLTDAEHDGQRSE